MQICTLQKLVIYASPGIFPLPRPEYICYFKLHKTPESR